MSGSIVLRQHVVNGDLTQLCALLFKDATINHGPQWDYVAPTPDMEGWFLETIATPKILTKIYQ